MAILKFQYLASKTLTYGAYYATNSVRTAAGTSFPEATVGTGDYYVVDGNVLVGDRIVIKEGSTIVGGGVHEEDYDTIENQLTAATIPDLAGVASNMWEAIAQVWRRFFKRHTRDVDEIKTFKDNNTTVATTQVYTASGNDDDVGAAT